MMTNTPEGAEIALPAPAIAALDRLVREAYSYAPCPAIDIAAEAAIVRQALAADRAARSAQAVPVAWFTVDDTNERGPLYAQAAREFWGQPDLVPLYAAAPVLPAPPPAEATDCDECDALRTRLADLLTRTANALRGEPPRLTLWSWHDLPERAAAAIAAIDVMQRAAMLAAPTPAEPVRAALAELMAAINGMGDTVGMNGTDAENEAVLTAIVERHTAAWAAARAALAAPQAPAVHETGPWTVDDWSNGRLALQSDDFAHDAALELTGDWGDADLKRRHAQFLADKLNAPAASAVQPLTVDDLRGLDTETRIRFYEHDFYPLSNFSAFMLQWRGMEFATSEHAYHWEKFGSEDGMFSDEVGDVLHAIFTAPSAHEAFKIAEVNKPLRRPDWDEVKVETMRRILRAKAKQHEYVRRKLLQTGDRELVEDSWRDDFWGWGPNRDGQNMLGKLWMEVRAELRAHGIAASAGQWEQKP